MKSEDYYNRNLPASEIHAQNILKYGPQVPFGHPKALPEQTKRIEFIVSHANGLILDVGSDSGYILNQCGGEVGLDLFLSRIKAAKYWYPHHDFVQASAENLPFKKTAFDTVILAELLEHVRNPRTVLAQAHMVLNLTGKLIVTVPDEIAGKSHLNPEHMRKFTEGSLKNLLNESFDIEEVEYIHGDFPSWCVCCGKQVKTSVF